MMRWLAFGFILILLVPSAISLPVLGFGGELQRGDLLPAIKLSVPKGAEAKGYLGLSGEGVFALSEVKGEVIVIEIFNMYCSNCQREAPRVNELYRLIERDPRLKGRIHMIGIGAGNTPLEVEVFRKNFQVPFPLFPDEAYAIHKMVGEVRTPTFICARKEKRGLVVCHINKGGFPDPKRFLKEIVSLSGM